MIPMNKQFENTDLAILITENMILEINSILAAPLTIGGSMMAPVVGGGLMGAYSAKKATEGNQRIVANLKMAKKNCPNDECKDKIDRKIDFYQSKINDASGSTIRRAAGGAILSGFASHLYHNHDRNKKIRDINDMRSSMNLNNELKKCEELPHGQVGQCKEKIDKLDKQLKGKNVYRNQQ